MASPWLSACGRRAAPAMLAALLVAATAAGPARAASAPGVPGLPDGVPAAATQPEPSLPAPDGWPFGEAFPRTSGTGRLHAGASYWSDFVYDDHGAFANPLENFTSVSALAPPRGTYRYPDGAARRNGADVFRAAVGVDARASYWRVDFNTLVDPAVPIVAWTFDTDDAAATGAEAWPAGAGVRSPGIERALVVSSRGARLLDASTGATIGTFPTTVDTAARSFVVRVPRAALPVDGAWRVRLAAGLADAAGTGFAPVGPERGAVPGGPAVYNVAFRSHEQEGPLVCPDGSQPAFDASHEVRAHCANFWMENDQAQTLANGADVSAYSSVVDWSALAARRTTPEPLVRGYSNRWYVSRLDLGQGVVRDSGGRSGDLRPNYLGRVQPYAVYVPESYRAGERSPLTWVLHSLGGNHNQYGGVAPSLLVEACEARGSICATTEGFGPDGWYFDEAEVDFWQVWRALADSYALDPEATVISGYSMGGYASYKLGFLYPDLFAKAMALEGPQQCGARIVQGAGTTAGAGHCADAGDTTPLVGNARWIPYVMTYGFADELVPITSGLQQVAAFDEHDYRYHAVLYPAEDHLVFAIQNDFSPATSQLGSRRRVRNPGHITFGWYPDLVRPDYGIGPTGAYWIRSPVARDAAPGTIARIDARSAARPDRPPAPVRKTSAMAELHPTPAIVRQLDWRLGAAPAPRSRITLELARVSSLGVDTERAGFSCGTIETRSDGPVRVRLLRLPAGRDVTVGSRRVDTSDSSGTATLSLPGGSTTAKVACAAPTPTASKPSAGRARGSAPETGSPGRDSPRQPAASPRPDAGRLPFTGAQLGALAALGAALLGGGLALRRRSSRHREG